jgi:hypothetical protein
MLMHGNLHPALPKGLHGEPASMPGGHVGSSEPVSVGGPAVEQAHAPLQRTQAPSLVGHPASATSGSVALGAPESPDDSMMTPPQHERATANGKANRMSFMGPPLLGCLQSYRPLALRARKRGEGQLTYR